jgi:hypothetical protein
MTVFLTDTAKDVHDKITKYAFSGAPQTLKELQEQGANTDLDVSYQYLRFFMEDDVELERIRVEYSAGRINTSVVKGALIKVLQDILKKHQSTRKGVDDQEIAYFMTPDPVRFGNPPNDFGASKRSAGAQSSSSSTSAAASSSGGSSGGDSGVMDVTAVGAWLDFNGLSTHKQVFAEHGIDGTDLQDITHDDLASMGIATAHARKAIVRLAKGLAD